MSQNNRVWSVYGALLIVALGFRLFVALRLPNDTPDDGRIYSQIANNVIEQHVFSHESQPPYIPSIIRLPGYPLFLAAIYKVFGHGNNTAVRVVQAVIDTLTCALVAWVAFEWAVDPKRKHRAALIAFALAAVCPFTAIYVATILTEVPTNFLAVALVLAVTFAFKATGDTNTTNKTDRKRMLSWWILAGLIAGIAVLFRPDSGLFAAAVGATLVLSALLQGRVKEFLLSAVVLSVAFCLVLVPWTIRNRRVFGVFQPLAPAHAEMPGEFVPRGYLLWVRTWIDDSRYVGPLLWSLDTRPIRINDFPDKAFDSKDEKDRVATLLNKYNNQSSTDEEPEPSDNSDDEADEEDNQGEDNSSDEEQQQTTPEEINVEMTPEIDAGFAQLGQERRAHSPLRYYIVLPFKRAMTLWCDTHSQYYPFDGELLPLEDLDDDIHQQYWLPLFAALTAIYSLLGVIGSWLLWRSRSPEGRRWVLLAALVIFLRLGFFATLEHPEPRYTVEIFPFLIILAGAGAAVMRVSAKTGSD
jgi:4-amino-4-deoxy-L-arabinose transferase-like glycosyltransferase